MEAQCTVDFGAMHEELRQRLAERVRTAMGPSAPGAVILLQGGEQQTRYDTDKEELFRQESNFSYLFGVKEAGAWGAVDVTTGESTLFMPFLGDDWAVWEGRVHEPDHYKEVYGVSRASYVKDMAAVLGKSGAKTLLLLRGVNKDSGKPFDEARLDAVPDLAGAFAVDYDTLMPHLVESRVIKTACEIEVLRHVNHITSAAHRYVMRTIRPGMHEYQLESLFLHYCSFHMHARFVPYSCICCTGPNGAILHYGGASSPLERQLRDGDMCLLDMGTEHHQYVSDITCSYPCSGTFTSDQKLVYQAVYEAQVAVREAVKPGVEWSDLHLLAEKVLLTHLVAMGVLVGDVDAMQKKRVSALFMPHGLGHMMGLDVHDVGGFAPGRSHFEGASLQNLRANRPLQAGMVMTNEPGLYFIPALLEPALMNPELAPFLVEERVRHFLDSEFGGIRLEDDFIVTETGCDTMTQVPRTIEEVEAFMAQPKLPVPDAVK